MPTNTKTSQRVRVYKDFERGFSAEVDGQPRYRTYADGCGVQEFMSGPGDGWEEDSEGKVIRECKSWHQIMGCDRRFTHHSFRTWVLERVECE